MLARGLLVLGLGSIVLLSAGVVALLLARALGLLS